MARRQVHTEFRLSLQASSWVSTPSAIGNPSAPYLNGYSAVTLSGRSR